MSAIIPLYNHAKYISEAVESVLDQGDLLLELIVIDDGSRDTSAELMSALAQKDPRITFLRQENRGAHATINRGLGLARGEFVTILNSDDAFVPGRFASLARALDLDPGSSLASSSIGFFNDIGHTIENPWFRTAVENLKAKRDVGLALIDANYLMTTSNFFMRRSLIETVGDFAPMRYTHDLEFALRCRARGVRFCFIDTPLMKYRFHDSNTISESHDRVRMEWALCVALYLTLMSDEPQGRDPAYRASIDEILNRHNLQNAVDLAVAGMKSRGARCVDDRLMSDTQFLNKILKAV